MMEIETEDGSPKQNEPVEDKGPQQQKCEPVACYVAPGHTEDPVEPDECWEEKYRGDSRRWTLRDGSYKPGDPNVASCMKDSYTYPTPQENPIGRRRKLLQTFLWSELLKETSETMMKPREIPADTYCTTYHINYDYMGLPENPENKAKAEKWKKKIFGDELPELFLKYPLYASHPETVYYHYRRERNEPGVSGKMINNPWNKNTSFTTPIDKARNNDEGMF